MGELITYKHYYKRYKQNVKGGPAKYQLTAGEYHKLLDTLNKEMRDYAIETGVTIKFPYKIGRLTVKREKYVMPTNEDGSIDYSRMSINWYLTSKLWKEKPELKGFKFIYHTNECGYIYRIEWAKAAMKKIVTYKGDYKHRHPWYTFKPIQSFKKRITHYIWKEPGKLWYRDNVEQNSIREIPDPNA